MPGLFGRGSSYYAHSVSFWGWEGSAKDDHSGGCGEVNGQTVRDVMPEIQLSHTAKKGILDARFVLAHLRTTIASLQSNWARATRRKSRIPNRVVQNQLHRHRKDGSASETGVEPVISDTTIPTPSTSTSLNPRPFKFKLRPWIVDPLALG